jgi:hypothetical protein
MLKNLGAPLPRSSPERFWHASEGVAGKFAEVSNQGEERTRQKMVALTTTGPARPAASTISELNTLEPLAHFPSGSPANCTSQRAKADICIRESPDPPWPMRFRGELWIYGMEYQLDQGDTDEICTV